MCKYFMMLIGIVIAVALSGCAPQKGVIPTVEEVVEKRNHITSEETHEYCTNKGGKIEDWSNDDGTYTTYCIFKQGYGCDPLEFYRGICQPLGLD